MTQIRPAYRRANGNGGWEGARRRDGRAESPEATKGPAERERPEGEASALPKSAERTGLAAFRLATELPKQPERQNEGRVGMVPTRPC